MSTHAINRVAGWLIVAACVVSIVAHLAALARGAEPITLAGVVTRVKDGDTLVVRSNGRDYTIRLAEIDAPEKRQPGGLNARVFLEAQAFGKQAIVTQETIDRYGRIVGHVVIAGQDMSARLVQFGHAWQYVAYSKSAKLAELEAEARDKKRGLWAAQEKPIPPWEWRRRDRRR
jgi:endonuclease YncB( thermonuclease family)